jgi:hypothetical protein
MKYALLDTTKQTGLRRDGNSTRQIDLAVQLLFSGKAIKVYDHYMIGLHLQANQDLFYRIMDRMTREHPGVKVFYNKSHLTISLNEYDVDDKHYGKITFD